MSFEWIFAAESTLPAGLEVETLSCASDELGNLRLGEAQALIGVEAARALALKAGPYELEEDLARRLELEGLKLGVGGEFSALSPPAWGAYAEAESWQSFTRRLSQAPAEIVGLQLTATQREAFLQFFSRNRVDPESTPAAVAELARHFFFGEPLNVVVRYTGPRFHHA